MNKVIRATITGTGMNLPSNTVSNLDLEKMVDTSDEWITTRTGIKSRRRVLESESLCDIALPAAQQALDNSGLSPLDIDLIIFSTFTPDYQVPASACIMQDRLGCDKAAAFDLQAACSGFIYGSSVAAQFIQAGTYKNILLIGGDVTTRILDFEDRNTCVLFGDGVGAAVFSASEEGDGIFDSYLGAVGSGGKYITIPMGGSTYRPTIEGIKKKDHYLKINGKEVFKFSTKIVGDMMEEILTRNNLNLDDVSIIIPHQANYRILESAARRFKCPKEKFYMNIEKYGNTVAASIPIALHEALLEGKIKEGDIIFLIGFGGGLTYGILPIKWGKYLPKK